MANFDWGKYEENPSAKAFNWDDYAEDKSSSNIPEESLAHKALRYGIEDPVIGAAKVGQGLHNAPYNIASLINSKLAAHMPSPDNADYSDIFGQAPQNRNLADKLIQFAPDLAMSFALPEANLGKVGRTIESIPQAGKYLKTALGNALSQGTYAAGMSSQDPGTAGLEAAGITAPFSALSKAALVGSPALKTLSRVALGAGGGALGYEGSKSLGLGDTTSGLVAALLGMGSMKGLNPRESALKGVEGTNYQEVLDAAKRLNLPYVTPAEASGNPFTGAEQGTIGKTDQGAQMLYDAGQKRAQAEKDSIKGLLTNIYDPYTHEALKNALYNSVKEKQIPEQELFKFRGSPEIPSSGNEIFKAAESKLLSDPAYAEALKGVPRNSLGYLDMVKRVMGDMIDQTQGKSKYKESLITGAQKDLVNTMDKVAPEYKDARALAEREITRGKLEDVFNAKPMTGSNFGKFLNNDKKFKELQNNVRNVPGAQDQLNDMKLVFNRLINIPTAKTAETLSRSSMSNDRATSATAIRMLQEILSGGRYDKARVSLITNPKWSEELAKLKNISKTDKFIGKSYDLLGKAAGQSISQ